MKKPNKPNKQTAQFIIFLMAWTVLAMILSQFVAGMPLAFLLGERFTRPEWVGVYYVLNYGLVLWWILWATPQIFAKTKLAEKLKIDHIELGFKNLPTYVDLGLAPIAYVVYIICANLLTDLMKFLPWFNPDEAQNVGFSHYLGGFERIIAMVAIVFIAPIAEEIIMRGWLYGKMRSQLKVLPAMILTSLVFAVLHGQWNVGVTVFALSLLLCTLREITGTIWSGMMLHMISNGIAFYLLYVANIL